MITRTYSLSDEEVELLKQALTFKANSIADSTGNILEYLRVYDKAEFAQYEADIKTIESKFRDLIKTLEKQQ